MTETLKQFLQSLSFVEINEIKRNARGLLKALEKSNRNVFLDYTIEPSEKMKEASRINKEMSQRFFGQ